MYLGKVLMATKNTLCAQKFLSAKSVVSVVNEIYFSGKLKINASKNQMYMKESYFFSLENVNTLLTWSNLSQLDFLKGFSLVIELY